jgi:hypothetical protein
MIEGRIAWAHSTLDQGTSRIVHNHVGVEEDVLNPFERALKMG